MLKQNISQIHIFEAFEEKNCECPLCHIEKSTELKLIEALYTELVMDIQFNTEYEMKYDFCKSHFEELYRYKDKLGLAIILNKVFQEKCEELEAYFEEEPKSSPKGFFKFLGGNNTPNKALDENNCFICKYLDEYLENSLKILFKAWQERDDFKKLFNECNGFCLKHYKALATSYKSNLKEKHHEEFKASLLTLQKEHMSRVQKDLEWFITKYDYRFKDEPWKTSQDALPRGLQKLNGNLNL